MPACEKRRQPRLAIATNLRTHRQGIRRENEIQRRREREQLFPTRPVLLVPAKQREPTHQHRTERHPLPTPAPTERQEYRQVHDVSREDDRKRGRYTAAGHHDDRQLRDEQGDGRSNGRRWARVDPAYELNPDQRKRRDHRRRADGDIHPRWRSGRHRPTQYDHGGCHGARRVHGHLSGDEGGCTRRESHDSQRGEEWPRRDRPVAVDSHEQEEQVTHEREEQAVVESAGGDSVLPAQPQVCPRIASKRHERESGNYGK